MFGPALVAEGAHALIKDKFLKLQASKSNSIKQTTPFLRRLVASTVDDSAVHFYGDEYAIKCLQTSWATSRLLTRLGIKAGVMLGTFCAAELYEDVSKFGWGGFWGDDHHLWTMTGFGEIVDLSVAHMTKHPRCTRTDGIPMPPIWWDDHAEVAPVFRYLPDMPVNAIPPDGPDAREMDAFIAEVDARFSSVLASKRVENIAFGPFLDNSDTMNRLTSAGHPWLKGALIVLDHDIPFPPWIRAREAELVDAVRRGAPLPSRFENRPDLVQIGSSLPSEPA